MSQARVQISTFAARKGATLKCERGHVIEKGDKYRYYYVGFRSKFKHVRCMRSECSPRPSELESSMVADAYAAIESAEDTLQSLSGGEPEDNNDSIKVAVTGAAEGIREVADQYTEAADNMGSGGDQHRERAETLEAAADELEGFDGETDEPDFDACENDEHDEPEQGDQEREVIDRGDVANCANCSVIKQEWWDAEISAGQDALSNVELP